METQWLLNAVRLEEEQWVIDQKNVKSQLIDCGWYRIEFLGTIRRAYRYGITKTREYALIQQAKGLAWRIDDHLEEASIHIKNQTLASKKLPSVDDSEDEDGLQVGSSSQTWHPAFDAICIQLRLPSMTAKTMVEKESDIAKDEVILRRAQMKEILRGLRASINEKFYWMRSKFQAALKKDRAISGQVAQATTDKINDLRRKYTTARKAFLFLSSSNEEEFPRLTAMDVRIPDWMINPNNAGARDSQPSWIWAGYEMAGTTDDTAGECANNSMINGDFEPNSVLTVTRISWLRARAQTMRWKEERNILAHEMEWTVRYFFFRYNSWRKLWARTSKEKPGHKAYAQKQIAMWRKLGEDAQVQFIEVRNDMPDVWEKLMRAVL